MPGVDVSVLDVASAQISVPTDTGQWFVAGLTDRGQVAPQAIISLDDFVDKYGDRQTYSILYDCIETFFKEGGNVVNVARVVGPAADSGTLNLLDGASAISLVATAIGPGAWSADYQVAVVAGSVGGTFVIQVLDSDDAVLEDSGNLADVNEAVLWSQNSHYIRLTLGVSANDPAVVASTALSAGDDDRSNITDTEWDDAIDSFPKDWGPGQISTPGRTSSAAHTTLVDHAEANNRIAILDLTDSASEATLAANVAVSRFAGAFAPWIQVPGISTTPTVVRVVPPSPLVAGLIARNDPSLGVNHPSAGRFGISSFAVGLSQAAWDDQTLEDLNSDGVNVIITHYGSITVFGWRTTVSAVSDPNWITLSNSRLFTKLVAEFTQVGENYLFEEIDGQNGQTIGGFHDALAGVCLDHYNQRELFGDTPDQAFFVDTGPTVNTLETIANNELHATVFVKMSPFAEFIEIRIVKRRVTEAI